MASYRTVSQRQPLYPVKDTTGDYNGNRADGKPGGEKNHWADVLKLVLFLGVGLFFIYWFLLKLDEGQKQDIWQSFIHADIGCVAAVMVCCLLSHGVRALRWQLLYEPMDCKPRLNSTFGSVVVAYMANLAFPRLGEVLRCATLRTSDGIAIEKSLGTVVTERCIDVLAFGVVVLIGLVAMYGQAKEWLVEILAEESHGLSGMAWIVVALAVVLVLVVILYLQLRKRMSNNKLFVKIDGIVQGGLAGLKSIFRLRKRSVLLFVLYSIGIYLLYLAGGLIILQAFPETRGMGFEVAFVLYLFGSVGMTISQGGLGAYPVLVWQSLALYGVGESTGLAAGWLLWGSQQVIIITVGLGYLVYFSLMKRNGKCNEN